MRSKVNTISTKSRSFSKIQIVLDIKCFQTYFFRDSFFICKFSIRAANGCTFRNQDVQTSHNVRDSVWMHCIYVLKFNSESSRSEENFNGADLQMNVYKYDVFRKIKCVSRTWYSRFFVGESYKKLVHEIYSRIYTNANMIIMIHIIP